MGWVPIHESALADAVDFGFSGGEGDVTFADSIVSQLEWNTYWWIALPTDPELPLLRVSVVEWAGEFSDFPAIIPLSWGFHWGPSFITSEGSTLGQEYNESPTPDSEWVPSPIQIEFPPPEIDAGEDYGIIQYRWFGESEGPASAQWLIEVWEDGPPEPVEIGDPYVIRGTHRAYSGGDTPQVAWIRTETGRMDLSGAESVTVDILRGDNKLLTIPATGDEDGRVDFTITAENIRQKLSLLGGFRLYVRADGRVIYAGLLDVLG